MPTARKKTKVSRPARSSRPARASKARLGIDDVRKIALALPETNERPSYGTPGFRVGDKLFARVLEGGDSLVVNVDLDQRESMIASAPHVFSVTPHYEYYPWVIVSLAAVTPALLRDLLTEAWGRTAPPRVLEAFGRHGERAPKGPAGDSSRGSARRRAAPR